MCNMHEKYDVRYIIFLIFLGLIAVLTPNFHKVTILAPKKINYKTAL